MTYKTILVHCDAQKTASQRLGIAAELAERFGSHLVGIHVRPPFELPALLDVGSAFPLDDLFREHEELLKANEAAASEAFAAAIKGRHLSAEWRVADGYPDVVLTVNARYADLVVLGQAEPDPLSAFADLPETVALATGRPTLVVPYIGAPSSPAKVAMLCWNASREAARAARDALPLLKAASKVVVLVVEPEPSATGHGAEPGADVAAWLARHGVKVVVQREAAPDADVGELILSRAADLDAGLIVMGVYGHSRLHELILGGASRTMLASMTVPVLMSH